MSQGRSINGDSPCAYRVVKVAFGHTNYFGPYSTLGAAKGKRTSESNYISSGPPDLKIWIEKTHDGWEKVDV